MWEKCKQALDNSQAFETLLTDLSKAFDCLPDELLIAKFNAYGFSLKALKLINNYVYRRKMYFKKMYFKFHGSWLASVPGPTLFNIFLIVLFLTLNNLNTAIVIPMTIPFIKHMTKLILLSKLWGCQPKRYSCGLNIINWKATHISDFLLPSIPKVCHGSECLSYLGSK